MRAAVFFVALLGLASPVAAQRHSLGIFFKWGAFRDQAPKRCFAIAEPERSAKAEDWRPFASVGFWPGAGVGGQVHFRLSRNKRPGSAVLLRIDDRTFQLFAGGANAWAADRRADAEIVAAMRSGIDMVVETRSDRGALVRDHYQLRGAATAIDAAAVACARRR
jgi:hypothetical protein